MNSINAGKGLNHVQFFRYISIREKDKPNLSLERKGGIKSGASFHHCEEIIAIL